MRTVKYMICWMVIIPVMMGAFISGDSVGILIVGTILAWSIHRFVTKKIPSTTPQPSQQLADVQERLRILKLGELPTVPTSINNINLKPHEQLFYSKECSISQSKTVSKYKAGTKGVSVTPIKGMSFRLGGAKGQMESQLKMVDVGNGVLNITSTRILLTGIQRPITMSLDALLTYDCTDSMIHLASDKAAYVLTVPSEEGSIIEYIIQQLLSNSQASV